MCIETAREAVQARKSTPSKTLREATPAGKSVPTEKSEESEKDKNGDRQTPTTKRLRIQIKRSQNPLRVSIRTLLN